MKYSIRGNLALADGSSVINILNDYSLWHLVTSQTTDSFIFEAWVNSVEEKDSLFEELKPIVDTNGESIDWHKCTHDEESPQPCVIAEEYRG